MVAAAEMETGAGISRPSGIHPRRSPWQNDYLYASKALTSKRILKQAFVQDSDGIEGLGDHMPLVADFDL